MKKLIVMTTFLVMGASQAQVMHWLSQPEVILNQVNNDAIGVSKFSANGLYLTISSEASNLVADDNNQLNDIFLMNLQTQTTELVTVSQTGDQAMDVQTTRFSKPTSDGRYIAFTSKSEAFGGEGFFGDELLYVKDMQTGAVVNHSDYGIDGVFEVSSGIFLSDDGNSVVFSTSEQIDPLHTDGSQIYRKTLDTDTFELLSVSADGLSGANDTLFLADVSDNGRYVLMRSEATNLTNDVLNNSNYNLFLRDTQTNQTILVNKTPSGDSTTTGAFLATSQVSNNGTVAFMSEESELVTNDTNASSDVFYYDGSQIIRINLDTMGNEVADSSPYYISISGNGSRIAWTDESVTMMGLPDGDYENLYVYNVGSDSLQLLTQHNGQLADGDSYAPDFSTNGNAITFSSLATNLTDTPQPGLYHNAYVHRFNQDITVAPVAATLPMDTVNDDVGFPKISSDQRYVIYTSAAINLTSQAIEDISNDLFLLDRQDNSHTLIGRNVNGIPEISPSGRYITFRSDYFQPDGEIDLGVDTMVLYDQETGTYTPIETSYHFAVNDEGMVVFEAENDLAANDNNGIDDVYVYDHQTAQMTLVSEGTGGNAVGGDEPDIAGSGNNVWLVYTSESDAIIIGDSNDETDVFLQKWPDGSPIRVSQTASGVEANDISYLPKLSANTQYVAFTTGADNLTSDDYSLAGVQQALRYNRQTLALELVSRNAAGLPLQSLIPELYWMSISDSGRYISYAFSDQGVDQDFPDDDDYRHDIVLYDSQTLTGEIISVHPNGDPITDSFDANEVVEDLTLSPPRMGLVFSGSHQLTAIEHHPGYDEIYFYQDGGPPFILNIEVHGAGSVSGTGAISCADQCLIPRNLGTEISLVAVPDSGETFLSWDLDFGGCSGNNNPCNLVMDRDKTLVVTFSGGDDIIFDDSFE